MVKKWMISELGLSGNDLVAYAFLYDATGKGENEYQGGYKQLTEVMNTTIPTTYNVLKHMAEKGLITVVDGSTLSIRVTRGES
mgnify:FL=1